jgi:hypothetical protein
MRICFSRAFKPHVSADIVPASTTKLTVSAGQADFQRNPLPRFEPIDVGTHADNLASTLMSESQGFSNEYIPIPEVFVIMQITAADAGGGYDNLNFIG